MCIESHSAPILALPSLTKTAVSNVTLVGNPDPSEFGTRKHEEQMHKNALGFMQERHALDLACLAEKHLQMHKNLIEYHSMELRYAQERFDMAIDLLNEASKLKMEQLVARQTLQLQLQTSSDIVHSPKKFPIQGTLNRM